MILLIDNYDSFSYNLVQMIGSIRPDIRVVRNDRITIGEIRAMAPDHLILSPGPGYPRDAGILEEAVEELKGEIPILGLCLGHQGICEAFGGIIAHAKRLMHGKQSRIRVESGENGTCPLFSGLPHEITAVQHRAYPVYGLQFHPESILTPDGRKILKNFLEIVK